jgi:hypothetical protein
MPTVADLIDYLRQFPQDAQVYLTHDEANVPDDVPFVGLDVFFHGGEYGSH